MRVSNRRDYVRKAFQMYVTHKQQLFAWEEKLKMLPIPGQSGLDYSHETVASGNGNGVEAQFANYVDQAAELTAKISAVKKKVELVRRTIEHFRVESRAKGKLHYKYICERWLQRRSYHRAAIECGIPERTTDFIIEEVFTIAETIGDEYELF